MKHKARLMAGVVGALAVLSMQAGNAVESFDETSESTTTHAGEANAAVTAASDISPDGVFSLTAKVGQQDVLVNADPARALASVKAKKTFHVPAAGEYIVRVQFTDVAGTATGAAALGSGASGWMFLAGCDDCVNNGDSNPTDLVGSTGPMAGETANFQSQGYVRFYAPGPRAVTIITEVSAAAGSGLGAAADLENELGMWASGGGEAAVNVTGALYDMVLETYVVGE